MAAAEGWGRLARNPAGEFLGGAAVRLSGSPEARDLVEGSGVKKRTVKVMRKKRKEILADGKELPEQWTSVLYGEREANPDWFDEQVKDFSDRLTKTFGPGATFSPGKQEIMADALIAWDQSRAANIAPELVAKLGLHEEVASHAALLAEEAKEFENLSF